LRACRALDDGALKLAWRVDDDLFKRLKDFAVALLVEDDLRLRDLQLVALAAHVLKQDGDVELAAARDVESLAAVKVDFEPDVDLELALKTLADLARGDKLAFAPGKRRVVNQKVRA
jgi:hypothetical protein